jgi:hypothetical protein
MIMGSPSSLVIGKTVRHDTVFGTSIAPIASAPSGCAFFLKSSTTPGLAEVAKVVPRQLVSSGKAAAVTKAFFKKSLLVSCMLLSSLRLFTIIGRVSVSISSKNL